MSTTSQSSNGQLVASIQIRNGNESPKVRQIKDGTSVIVGSDERCGIRLTDPQISSKHCTFRMTEGEVFVNDWYSECGTFVNGEKIYSEARVKPHDSLQIGPYQIRLAITTSNVEPEFVDDEPALIGDDEPVVTEPFSSEQVNVPPSSESPSDPREPTQNSPLQVTDNITEMNRLREQLAAANSEIEQLKLELECQLSVQSAGDPDGESEFDPMQADEVELLRMEVSQLQSELTQRDSDLQDLLSAAATNSDELESPETTHLVERLEQLLDELHDSDARVRSLENLLRVSDEATHAEFEERQQLEGWVSEIESRIGDLEQQWRAREESLQSRLEEESKRRTQAEENVSKIVQGRTSEFQQQWEQQMTELRTQNDVLKTKLEQANSELQQLHYVVQQSGMTQNELEDSVEKENELREQEMELAKERASLARQRAEIARARDDFERSTNSIQTDVENPDVRLRAFRNHLKEIHEEEQREKRQRSLSSRIAKIWQRLEGR